MLAKSHLKRATATRPGRGLRGNVRRGMSLIELLVVLATVGILCACSSPPSSSAREAAALRLANNLKQTGPRA